MSNDNLNKKPDNNISNDEELASILKKLSLLLDKSVSLEEAIELAKKQETDSAKKSADGADQANDDISASIPNETASVEESAEENPEDSTAESPEETASGESTESDVHPVTNTAAITDEPQKAQDSAETESAESADNSTEKPEPTLSETPDTETNATGNNSNVPEEATEKEELIYAEKSALDKSQEKGEPESAPADQQEENQSPVLDFLKTLRSSHFAKNSANRNTADVAMTETPDFPSLEEVFADEVPVAEDVATEDTPVAEEVAAEDTPAAEEVAAEDTPAAEEVAAEDIPAAEEVTEEDTPVVEEVTEEDTPVIEDLPNTETTPVTSPASKSDDTELATSKIFDELLACFENHKLPDDFRFSEYNTHAAAEELKPAEETSEESPEATTKEQASEETEPAVFVPIDHSEHDQEDELFSKIFSEEKSEKKNKEKDRKKWQKQGGVIPSALTTIYDWLEVAVLSTAFAILMFTFVFRLAVVDGDSMNNTLHHQEVLIISNFMYEPENNDIIVFSSPSYDNPLVKRIIATEGQTVDIDFKNWKVTVDGVVLEEDYINYLPYQSMESADVSFPLTVPEGHVFVMGDNRNNSSDSRNTKVGFVDERYILGKVKLRLSPFNKFGTVD